MPGVRKEKVKMNSYKPILAVTVVVLLMFTLGYASAGKKGPPSKTDPNSTAQKKATKVSVEPAQGEEINWQVISSGGTKSTSANHVLSGTVAQTAVGHCSSANYGLSHGFWQEYVCCVGIRGNVDGDPGDNINVADLTYLVDYLFRGGPPPPCTEEGNVDGDPGENINIADLTYLVDYLFRGGPPPPPCP
jgi:hypothetical protein